MFNPNQPKSAAPSIELVKGFVARSGVLHFSMVELLIALVLLFASAPFIEQLQYGNVIESALMTMVLIAAVLAVGARRRTLVIAVLLVSPAVIARWVNHFRPDLIPDELKVLLSLVFMIFVVVNLLGFILRAPIVTSEVLCAGIAGYLLLGLIWAFAYVLLAQQSPASFVLHNQGADAKLMDQFSAFYFSFVTLTTTGFGDITPVSRAARMLTVMEAVVGTFYVTILIARLVAMYSTRPRSPEADTPESD